MREPAVIAVTGPDGSGKSTLCARLSEALGAARVSVWDAMASSGLFATRGAVAEYFQDLDGPSRTLFIYHALSRSMDLAARSGARILLVEGYWYKYAVTEIAYGVDPKFVEAAASAFQKPLLTIRLDVAAEESWSRKSAPTAYESGDAEAPGVPSEARYVAFQSRLRPIWESLEGRHGPWARVPAGASPEVSLEFALERCRRALGAEEGR